MKLDNMTLEAYLDGELSAAEKARVDQALAHDSVLRGTLGRLESQRALRAAAMAGYLPDAATTAAATEAFLDQCHAPVGRIGVQVWLRRFSAVAAMVIIAGGSFIYGRVSAPVAIAPTPIVQERYVVNIISPSGDVTEHVFASKDEADDFVDSARKLQLGTVVAGVM